MTAKFSEIQSQYKLSLSGSDDGTTSSSGDTRSSNDSGVSVSSRHDTGSSTVSVKGNNQGDVIKCHSGRAINQDKEVLESAENPILGELRRGRLGGGSSLGKRQRQEEIERLRNKATLTRKNRQQVRGQKLAAHNSMEQQSLEDELERLDTELEETESKLTKLQLLVQSEKDTSHNLKPSMKNKTQSSNSVTCSTKVSTTTSVGRKQNSRPPQRKQEAVSAINKCITSKVVGSTSSTRKTSVTPLCKTDTGLSSQVARSKCLTAQRGVTQRSEAQRGVAQRGVAQRGVAQQGTTGSNGCRSNNTQNETKTSTVQQKLKVGPLALKAG
ncbi:hypothetical protein LSAT2_008272 [Lamellibrachia satsuma]|nr:hypothetical protein LSAT2_008272 [Lamellibrachia satsuma]